jgi:hypothetical protein
MTWNLIALTITLTAIQHVVKKHHRQPIMLNFSSHTDAATNKRV